MRSAHLAIILPLLLIGLTPAAATAQEADTIVLKDRQQATYDRAVQAFRERRFPAAYGRFAELADAGHVPSARVALVMYHNGSALFNSLWYASPDQQRKWNTLTINSARHRMQLLDNAGDE